MNGIRAQIERLGKSTNPVAGMGYRGIKALGALRRFLVSARIRSQMLTRFRYQDRFLQGEAISADNRYPDLFEECRLRLAGLERPRILSFGCATGEEVFSLARYLPQAEIVGVDINPWCLKQCVGKNANEKLRFIHRLSPEFSGLREFDAIFCMAVFQRTEHRTEGASRADTGFTFERFDEEIQLLDGMLKPGGLFFLDACDFSFSDTAVAARYGVADFVENRAVRERPLFGRDNRRIAVEYASPRCFVKRANP